MSMTCIPGFQKFFWNPEWNALQKKEQNAFKEMECGMEYSDEQKCGMKFTYSGKSRNVVQQGDS